MTPDESGKSFETAGEAHCAPFGRNGALKGTVWEKGLKQRMGHTKSVEVRLHADVGSTLTQKGPESVLTVGGYRGFE